MTNESLHYRLAFVYGHGDTYINPYNQEINICDYTKSAMFGFLYALVTAFVISVVIMVFFAWVPLAIWSVINQSTALLLNEHHANAHCSFLFLSIVICLGVMFLEYLEKQPSVVKYKPKKPSFISQAYESFKNKYCFKIKIEG